MAKIAGKDVTLKVGDPLSETGVFDVKFDEQTDELDVTDSMSAGDSREYLTGLVNRQMTFNKWYSDADTPLNVGDTTNFELILGTKKWAGALKVTGRNLNANRDDASRYEYTARVTGAVTFGATT